MRARQLEYEGGKGRGANEKKEYQRLKGLLSDKNKSVDRSRCLSCGHVLSWYDLLPVISWLWLRGRCRYCKESIGVTEFVLEITLGLLFVTSVVFWPVSLDSPFEWVKLFLWLGALVVLAINFVYDLKWMLLVGWLNWLLIFLGGFYAVISAFQALNIVGYLASLVGALMILSGLYGFLWLISKGRWVGEGDIYLGAGLALFIGDWRLAFVALFASNLVGLIIIIPSIIGGRVGRGSQVPFGPMLIAGSLIAKFFGSAIIFAYISWIF